MIPYLLVLISVSNRWFPLTFIFHQNCDPLWNFFNLFNAWSPSPSWQFLWSFFLIVSDWLLLLLSSLTFGNFFSSFKTWDDLPRTEWVRIVGIKGNYCALVYFLYLKHQAFSSVPQSSIFLSMLYFFRLGALMKGEGYV